MLARKTATVHSLDPSLVCAVVEQESAWNPCAIRYEPAFFSKFVASLYTNNKIAATEAYARGFSWGLMQVMGQVGREETGFFDAMAGDTTRALFAWKGGANTACAAQVLARRAHYL